MNRYHYIIIFCFIMLLTAMPLMHKHKIGKDIANECNSVEDAVNFATYAATIKMKTTDDATQIKKEWITAFSKYAGITEEETIQYLPAFVVLDNDRYYICSPALDNTMPKPGKEYTRLDMTFSLSGNFYRGGLNVDHHDPSSELQTLMEREINDLIGAYNNKYNSTGRTFDLLNELSVKPDRSIIVIFQGYPITSGGFFYSNTHQSSGQIETIY